MARSDRALASVRGAYRRAHLLAGGIGVVVAAALVALATLLHRTSHAMWLAAGALAITLAVFGWRGGATRRGALAGVLAGLPPMLTPVVVSLVSHGGIRCADCPAMPSLACTLACFSTAAIVGLIVGHQARHDAVPVRYAFPAIATAVLTGALGCGTTGLGGALGIAIGLVAGSVTSLIAARS